MTDACDVLVVGGGPAGSITALELARLGYDVKLVEALPMPRHHIGESITIGVHHQLSHLGIESVLESGGRQVFHAHEERWTESIMTLKPAAPGAATINRGMFDAACLERCSIDGVKVIAGRRTRSVKRVKPCEWHVTVEGGLALHARFVVDAAGKRGVLPRLRETTGARTIALYGYWSGDGLPTLPRVFAGSAGWAWGAPIFGLGYNVTLFVDRTAIGRCGGDVHRAYMEGISDAAIFDTGAGPVLRSDIVACDATAWFEKASVGRDFIKIGEAAQSLDPLASMGVQNAIQTAMWASIVINTVFRRPEAEAAALGFFQDKILSSAKSHAAAVAEIYASNSEGASLPFWARRAALRTPPMEDAEILEVKTAPATATTIMRGSAPLVDHACLCGSYVETRRAILVRGGGEPVAFLGGFAVADVINRIAEGCAFGELQEWLATQVSTRLAERLLNWLFRNDVIRPIDV
ncbi:MULTISPECIES: flavin-dependent monooxygenase QhpG [Rhizobium]|uniref:Tryptophan 7-halogenase n=1 Tax=Rhizobium aouanii TaxID=3118145 RepID=A0ABU8CJ77_9HYPH|nr:tryptophan 7-halogenase [Rhizobium acaciae]MCW1410817.1 tryptophan 7-halogenase [Rhizobium acaciae]MCW1742884.1 tryptophan 7-halogenase [Rhizobium acaciae]MCW1750080.1 tryptophan 7-halogenase [Rhizobium acaciae]